ncbi:STAS domain-containing protein [Actinacidiphila yeochonensis]|uniref:STAS domain-containing protein n=1 Tax=Actinacidiphila yeochonensis TaxID=89050 RepID=UPI00068F08D6|nr:STAS domain-containing protein [Actinacidiphila yeochonensis]
MSIDAARPGPGTPAVTAGAVGGGTDPVPGRHDEFDLFPGPDGPDVSAGPAGSEGPEASGGPHGPDGSAGLDDSDADEGEAGTVCDLWAPLTVRLRGGRGRLRAHVLGEADMAGAGTLEAALSDAVRRADALDVDLSDVSFLDCSGLNCLLRVRSLARSRGTAFTVTAAAPAAVRLFALTGTAGLLMPDAPTAAVPAQARTGLRPA